MMVPGLGQTIVIAGLLNGGVAGIGWLLTISLCRTLFFIGNYSLDKHNLIYQMSIFDFLPYFSHSLRINLHKRSHRFPPFERIERNRFGIFSLWLLLH
jgi:hypothetical protein